MSDSTLRSFSGDVRDDDVFLLVVVAVVISALMQHVPSISLTIVVRFRETSLRRTDDGGPFYVGTIIHD